MVKCQSGKKFTVPYVVYEKTFPCQYYPPDENVTFYDIVSECDGVACDIKWESRVKDANCDMKANINDDGTISITWNTEAESKYDSYLSEDLIALNAKGWASHKAPVSIGGFYHDPNHYEKGSFKGTRMISDEIGDVAGDKITLVGSDDGTTFWTLQGTWTSKAGGKIVIDFSPKGGPANLNATVYSDRITFQDGNSWTKQNIPN